MRRDISGSAAWRSAWSTYERALSPGFDRLSGPSDLQLSPDGRRLVFCASVLSSLSAPPAVPLWELDLTTGVCRRLTSKDGLALGPRHSPDGRSLAFMADPRTRWVLQPCVLGPDAPAETRMLASIPGSAESLAWHPSGDSVMVLVAGAGADQSTAQGGMALTSEAVAEAPRPSWFPQIESPMEGAGSRQLWRVPSDGSVARAVSPRRHTIWSFSPLGSESVVVLWSEDAAERAWYTARLGVLRLGGEQIEPIPTRAGKAGGQIGSLAGSPSGRAVAYVEGAASDRGIVAGDVFVAHLGNGPARHVDSRAVDVTQVHWLGDNSLVVAGMRGDTTVIATVSVHDAKWTEVFCSDTQTCGLLMPECAVAGTTGAPVVAWAQESFRHPPALMLHARGTARQVLDTSHEGSVFLQSLLGEARHLQWSAPDRTPLSGWLLRPPGPGPFPTVTDVHGGPVWQVRSQWHGRQRQDFTHWLSQGMAVFMPNIRGSTGRGQAHARSIVGEMGRAAAGDVVAGIDTIVAAGWSDPERQAVSGGSYGGYMACWLPCLDSRFKAAVAMSPVTNWVSQHFTSNIPHFDALYVGGDPFALDGRYVGDSPVLHSAGHRTPTLMVAGAGDRATPAEQALEFVSTLRERGVPAQAVIYSGEGHGVRQLPAMVDVTARATAWLRRYLLDDESALDGIQ